MSSANCPAAMTAQGSERPLPFVREISLNGLQACATERPSPTKIVDFIRVYVRSGLTELALVGRLETKRFL